MSGQPEGAPSSEHADPVHLSTSSDASPKAGFINLGHHHQVPVEPLPPYSFTQAPLSLSYPTLPQPSPPPAQQDSQHQSISQPSPSSSFSSPIGPPALPQELIPRSDSPRRKFPAVAGSSGPANAFKRARTSSPGSEAGPSPSAANSDMGDVESPGVQSSYHHSGPQGSRNQQENEYAEPQSHSMSETGSSLRAMIDATALRLSDPTPPPDCAMVSPSVHEASASPSLGTPPQPRVQKVVILDLMKQAMKHGDSWYLVSKGWFDRWIAMCDGDEQSTNAFTAQANGVGPVDNGDLIDDETRVLRLALEEGENFVLVPSDAWQLLVNWYDISGEVFERQCILDPNGRSIRVEIYLPQLSFSEVVVSPTARSQLATAHVVSMSRATPLLDVRKRAMHELQLMTSTEVDVRLWYLPNNVAHAAQMDTRKAIELEGSAPIEEYQLLEPLGSVVTLPPGQIQPIGIEVRQSDGSWPSAIPREQVPRANVRNIFAQTGGDSFSRLQQTPVVHPEPQSNVAVPRAMTTRSKSANDRASGVVLGLKGLSNMGNTCFMNSALQCLSNTPELRDYFTSKVYEDEINRDNPLGNGGQLAQAFGVLIQQLWSGSGTAFQPRDFKWSLARFAPQFSGYAQQDTQELLAFLLDGLHEDLNRIKKKPYIEAPDWEGGDLKAMVKFAKKQWEIYKARNDSVIVDLFQGQYRSTLVCPECSKVSIKFDPFMYLTLPMPSKTKWKRKVTFIPYDPTDSIKVINVTLPLEASMSKLKQTISDVTGVNPKRLVSAEIYQRKVWRYFYDYEPVHTIEKADFAFFWELPEDFSLTPPKLKGSYKHQNDPPPVHVQQVEYHSPPSALGKEEHVVLPLFTVVTNQTEPIGLPFFVSISKRDANDPSAIRREIVSQYRRYSSNPDKLVAIADSSGAAGQAMSSLVAGATAPLQSDDAGIGGWEVVSTQLQTPAEDAVVDTFAEITPNGDVIETSRSRSSSQEVAVVVGPSIVKEISPAAYLPPEPFEIVYMVTAPESSRPLPHEAVGYERAGEELFDRAKRLEATQGANPSIPLVYTSGSLVCVWSQEAAAQLLLDRRLESEWGNARDEVDDPQTSLDKVAAAQKRRGKDTLHIDDCLDEFTKEEKLGEEDPWYCPQCKDFRQATKKFDLWKVPDILVVHLKRFSSGRGLRDKIETVVDFPIEGLDLTERVEAAKAVQQLKDDKAAARRGSADSFDSGSSVDNSVSPADLGATAVPEDLSASVLSAISEANDDAVTADKPIYDLFAVDNHFGGLGGGHYTASAKNDMDGKWHYFDDAHVRDIRDADEIKSSAAYLLFYRRRTTRPIGGKSREIIKNARVKDEEVTAHRPRAEGVVPEAVDEDGDDTMKVSVEDYTSSFAGPSMPASGLWGGNVVSSARTIDSDDGAESAQPLDRHRLRRLSWAEDSPQMPGSFNYNDAGVEPSSPLEGPLLSSYDGPFDERDDTPPESFARPSTSAVPAAEAVARRLRQQQQQYNRRRELSSDSDEADGERWAKEQDPTSASGSAGATGPAYQLTRGSGRPPRYSAQADEDQEDCALLPSAVGFRGSGDGGGGGDRDARMSRPILANEDEDEEAIASDQAEPDISSSPSSSPSSSSSSEGEGVGVSRHGGDGSGGAIVGLASREAADSLPMSRRNVATLHHARLRSQHEVGGEAEEAEEQRKRHETEEVEVADSQDHFDWPP